MEEGSAHKGPTLLEDLQGVKDCQPREGQFLQWCEVRYLVNKPSLSAPVSNQP